MIFYGLLFIALSLLILILLLCLVVWVPLSIFHGNLIIITLFLLATLLTGATFLIFVDPWAALLIGVPLLTLAIYRFRETRCGLSVFFRRKFTEVYGEEVELYVKTARFFSRLAFLSIGLGFLVLLMSSILISQKDSPNNIGYEIATGLLSFQYGVYFTLFVFLPISLRCISILPQATITQTQSRVPFIRGNFFLIFIAIAAFFIVRMVVLFITILITTKNAVNFWMLLFFSSNPVDDYIRSGSLSSLPLGAFVDFSSFILVIFSLLVFKNISGSFYRQRIIPFCLLMGLFWMVLGCILIFGNLSPTTFGLGFVVAMLPFQYGLIAAGYYYLRSLYGKPATVVTLSAKTIEMAKTTETVEVNGQMQQDMPEKQNGETAILQRSSCSRRILQILIPIFALFVFWCWYDIFSVVPLRISKETTYITSPFLRDTSGLPPGEGYARFGNRLDYFAAIEERVYPPEMKTEDNGYRRVVAALGLPPFSSPPNWMSRKPDVFAEQFYEKLGFDPKNPPEPIMEYLDLYSWLSETLNNRPQTFSEPLENPPDTLSMTQDTNDELEDIQPEREPQNEKEILLDKLVGATWTLQDIPEIKEWIDANSPVLDLVSEAVAQKAYCSPLVRDPNRLEKDDAVSLIFENYHTTSDRNRSFARGLIIRARYRVLTGDFDGAIDDAIAILRLGNRAAQPTMLNYLTSLGISGNTFGFDLCANPEVQPTREQLQRYLDLRKETWAQRISFADALETERLGVLSRLENWSTTPLAIGRDYNVFMQLMNEGFDDHFSSGYEARKKAFSQEKAKAEWYSFLWTRKLRSIEFAWPFLEQIGPQIDRARGAFERSEKEFQEMNAKIEEQIRNSP